MPANLRLECRVNKETSDLFDAMAEDEGQTRSSMLRIVVEARLEAWLAHRAHERRQNARFRERRDASDTLGTAIS